MINNIKKDLYRYGLKISFFGFLRGWFIPGFKYFVIIRLLQGINRHSILRLPLVLLKRRYMFKYGFQISDRTVIGHGFFLGHFGNVVINPDVKIGNNCNISHGVTIGKTNRGKLKGSPTLNDLVWVGTNSVIVGNITIGSNVLIAPNSYINFSIPNNSIVVGNPGKIKYSENPTHNYINNILSENEI
jgi:serine O-acetyltransferase